MFSLKIYVSEICHQILIPNGRQSSILLAWCERCSFYKFGVIYRATFFISWLKPLLLKSRTRGPCRLWHQLEMHINSSPPSATYMRQRTGSLLVRVMAWCLFSAKPLPEQMLPYCHLGSRENISVKHESELHHFHSGNAIENLVCDTAAILSRGRWV